MSSTDIIALIITLIGICCFASVISILYKHYIVASINDIKRGNKDIELLDLMIYENDKKVQRRNKITGIIKNVVYYTVLALLIPVFGLSIYSKIKNNVTTIGGNSVLVVASGSMSKKNPSNDYLFINNLNNQFQTYDMIVVEKVKSEDQLQTYDVIAFRNKKGTNIIHRIRSISKIDGVTHFITRGDAVDGDDGFNPTFKDVIGVYRGKRIRSIGVFIMFFQSYIGIITAVSVVYTMIFISIYNRKLLDATYDREELLLTQFDIDAMDENSYIEFEKVICQKIYYKGHTYIFNEDSFIEKHEMNEEEKIEFQKLQEISKEENKPNKMDKNEEEKKHGEKQ